MLDLDTRRAILQLKALGHGMRAIARTLRISRNSVRTVLAKGSAEVPSIEREQILDEHLDTLRSLYAECRGNRVRVWEEAQAQGISISYPALTAFLRRQGVGVKQKQPAGRYHFEPGEEMQHDTSPHDVEVGGKVRQGDGQSRFGGAGRGERFGSRSRRIGPSSGQSDGEQACSGRGVAALRTRRGGTMSGCRIQCLIGPDRHP